MEQPPPGAAGPVASDDVLVLREVLAPEPAAALAGMLDIDVPTGGLPPLWHWVYLLERRPQRDLGPDGHPVQGIPAPPGPGRRRMFAGGRVRSHRPLLLDRAAERRSWVASTREKAGRSGPLTFVTVRTDVFQDGAVCLEEEQDIVYRPPTTLPDRPAADPTSSPVRSPHLTLEVTPALLFRFSALTYNAHRIHYDHEFVREEGYADLVVHGPLQALMMGELFRRHGTTLLGREYTYRLVAPMVGPQSMTVTAGPDGLAAGVETLDGQGVVTGTGRLRRV